MKQNKFIVTVVGEIYLVYAEYHRDILPKGETSCLGGGMFKIEGNNIECYGKSDEFGACPPDKIKSIHGIGISSEGCFYTSDYTYTYVDQRGKTHILKFDKHGKRITA